MKEPRDRMPLAIYFSSHEGEAISPSFDQLFANTDVIVLELAQKEGCEELERLYNELSQGKKAPEDLRRILPGSDFPDFEEKLYVAIYRSGKTVYVEHSPLRIDEVQRVYQLYGWRISGVSLEEALREYKAVLQELANYQKRRDMALARQLRILVKDRPDSSVLVIRGAGHERTLKASLAGAGVSFTSYHSHEPMLLLHESVVKSKLALGEEPVQMDLLKCIVETAELGSLPPTQANIGAIRQRMRSLKESELQNRVRKMLES